MMEVTNNDSVLREGGGDASSYYGDGIIASSHSASLNCAIYKSRARINGEVWFDFIAPRPNLFHRFWYWALLGWTWESLE